jgi:hypothetical protein
MMIWNPDFDLGTNSRDIPCNDVVMMKIRNGKLYTTIQNRSNDLHWGLPTNIFQFGFISEIMANVLGVILGTQTHNSQSLHVYDWNQAATTMQLNYKSGNTKTLYEINGISEFPMDIKFDNEVPGNRLRKIDIMLERIIANLKKVAAGKDINSDELSDVLNRSKWFSCVYRLLEVYLIYKRAIAEPGITKEARSNEASMALLAVEECLNRNKMDGWDIGLMARNFFANKITDYNNSEIPELGKL